MRCTLVLALAVIFTPCMLAIRLKQTEGSVPNTRAACGIIMIGAGNDDYMLRSVRNAQRVAKMNAGKGWCRDDLEQDHYPVIYYHDRVNGDSLIEKGLQGEAPLFESFYLGEANAPLMDNFAPLPKIKGKSTFYFKWYRPQIFKNSPFKLSLNLDGDGIPCGDTMLTEPFKALVNAGVVLASPAHKGGLNAGFILFDTEAARPIMERWAADMQHGFETCPILVHDQPSYNSALKATNLKTLAFKEDEVCREPKFRGCATQGCWVDHRDWTDGNKYKGQGEHPHINGIADVDAYKNMEDKPHHHHGGGGNCL